MLWAMLSCADFMLLCAAFCSVWWLRVLAPNLIGTKFVPKSLAATIAKIQEHHT